MSKVTKKEKEKMKIQMGIEERGRQRRPAVFTDRRAESRKNACRKQNVKKEIEKYS